MSEVLPSGLHITNSDDTGYPSANILLTGVELGGEDASLDPLAGGTANGKPIWTPEQIAANLNRTHGGWGPDGVHQPGSDTNYGEITFGFHTSQDELFDNGYGFALGGQLYAFSEYFNFAPFTDAQKDAAREAIHYWDDVVAVSFREVSDPFQADIAYGNLASAPQTQAYAYIPNKVLSSNATVNAQIQAIGGDVWVSASQPSNFQFDEGLYGLNTLVHETGHALGLSHPGPYNFGPNFTANYTNGAVYAQDARNYSIMSYWNPRDMGSTSTGVPTRDFDWSLMSIAYGSTPMVHDILAAQAIYGADMTTRTGDTTYGFNSTADRDAFDFNKTPWPTMTIWDAGGNDTLDASGYKVTQVIDLTPGSLSSIGGITYADALANLSFDQVNANRAAVGYDPISLTQYNANMAAFASDPEWRGRLTDNVGIAYGTTIENAKGGSGNDLIIGNAANNVLDGNAGNDTIRAGDGIDVVTLGGGNDTFIAELGTKAPTKVGALSWDIITDFDANGDDVIDLSGLGAFNFNGTNANKNPFDLTYKVYDSVNGAEHALGIDIHDQPGGNASGPVTVVFGNMADGGTPDFAMVLLNTRGVDANDFVMGSAAGTSAIASTLTAPTALAASTLSVDHQITMNHQADYILA